MAAIPEAMEGMQLSQRFSGAAHQLQADMDALKLSLETLDFGETKVNSLQADSLIAYADWLLRRKHLSVHIHASSVVGVQSPDACVMTGRVQALPDASSALEQANLLDTTYTGTSDQPALAAYRDPQDHSVAANGTQNSPVPDSSDLSAFLSGEHLI